MILHTIELRNFPEVSPQVKKTCVYVVRTLHICILSPINLKVFIIC